MKFGFIEEHREAHSVVKMAGILGVTRGGYYAWRRRARSERSRQNEQLVEDIKAIHQQVKDRYGSPRIHRELRRRGVRAGHNRVARLMCLNGLGARRRKRYRSTTDSAHDLPVAENLLNRRFEVSAANKVWVSDLTYIPTAEGWLYLCTVMDLHSRKIVGWSMYSRMTSDLVVQALMMAVIGRRPPKGLIFHSDRGSQYCSHVFRKWTQWYGIRQSMSRKGDCWNNATAESFFKTLKAELYGHRAFRSRQEARTVVFEYIEVFYNRVRLHSKLEYCSPPVEYERQSALDAA
jgi:transposase InsO family protein